MRATWTLDAHAATLRLRPEPWDREKGEGQNEPVRMLVDDAHFAFGRFVAPHPDLLALAALTVTVPWAASLTMDRPVSERFADTAWRAFGIAVEPVDPHLAPRQSRDTVGVSFGAGVDSAVAWLVLGSEGPLIHMARTRHPRVPNRFSEYRGDAFRLAATRFGEATGADVHIVESDVEYVCGSPHPSFPTWAAIATGALLLADELDLGAVAFGTVLGSAYARENRFTPHDGPLSPWPRAFAAAGLPMVRPITGISETSTTRIIAAEGLAEVVRSCPFGTREAPCGVCMKCFRKHIVGAAAMREPLPASDVARYLAAPAIRRFFSGPLPYNPHMSFEYAFARLPELRTGWFDEVYRAIAPNFEETAYLEAWYPKSVANDVPPRWRARVKRGIESRVRPMTDREITVFEGWDAERRVPAGREPQSSDRSSS